MSAFAEAQQTQPGSAENGSRLRSALHSALEAALMPARLAGSVWNVGWGAASSAVGVSERAVSSVLGALVGAAWGAATGGTELFLISLQKLLQHTPQRMHGMLPPRLLGGPEGGAAERAEGSGEEEAQAVGLGGGYTLNVASPEAAPEEPTPQAEPAVEREAEVAALASKGGQFVEKAEPGIGVAAPREPVTPARAPAFAPLSPGEERTVLAAAPVTVVPLPVSALGGEPRSPVAKIDAHMRAVQEFRAKTAEVLKAEEALPDAGEAVVGLVAPFAAGMAGASLAASQGRMARRSPVPLERIPSDVTGQEGRPLAPGLEALPEGPEGTSAEGSAHTGAKRSASIPLEAAAAGAGAALVPEKFEALEGSYGRGVSSPFPGADAAQTPLAMGAADLGVDEDEGPPPLAGPSPANELEGEEAELAGRAVGGPAAASSAPPAAREEEQQAAAAIAPQPAGVEPAATEGPLEAAEARLKGLFAPVGAAAITVGGLVGGGLVRAGATAGSAAGAVAEALHIPGISRAGPEEPAVAEGAGAAGAAEAGAAPAPELQPPHAAAGAATLEADQEEAPATASPAAERGLSAAAAEKALAVPAAPEAAADTAAAEAAVAAPPAHAAGWGPGSEALLGGRSGDRVTVQRVHLPELEGSVTLAAGAVTEEKVASEMVSAQKQRILAGAPPAAPTAAAAAVPTTAAPASTAAAPIAPAEQLPPASGAGAAEAGGPAAAAVGLAADGEAPPAAAAQLAAAEEAAVEGRPAAAAAVTGEELGVTVLQEEGAKAAEETQVPAAAAAACPSPFDIEEGNVAAAPAAMVEPGDEEAAVVPHAPADSAVVAEKAALAPAEEPAVTAPPTPAKAAAAAPSTPEILPLAQAPAAVGAPTGAAAGPKKKKRNPIHKIQKMMGLKPYSTPRS